MKAADDPLKYGSTLLEPSGERLWQTSRPLNAHFKCLACVGTQNWHLKRDEQPLYLW